MLKNYNKASLGMFGAAVIWGTWVLVLNGITLPGFFVTAITSFTGFVGLFIIVILTGEKNKLISIIKTPKLLKIIALIALLESIQNGLFMITLSIAIQEGGSVYIPIIRSMIGITTPLFVLFILKKEFAYRYIFMGLISMIGAIVILSWGGIGTMNKVSYWVLMLTFGSVLVWTIQNIAQRMMAIRMMEAKQNEYNVITYQSVLSALFLAPFIIWYLATNTQLQFEDNFINQIMFIGVFGFTHVALAFILRLNALKHITAQQAVIIGYLEPVTSVALSIVFLNESINTGFVIGAILILGSAIAAGIIKNSEK